MKNTLALSFTSDLGKLRQKHMKCSKQLSWSCHA